MLWICENIFKEVFKMTLNREEWRQTTQMNENGWKLFKIEQNSSKVVKIGPKRNKQIWAIESASQLKKHFNYLIWHIWPNFIGVMCLVKNSANLVLLSLIFRTTKTSYLNGDGDLYGPIFKHTLLKKVLAMIK